MNTGVRAPLFGSRRRRALLSLVVPVALWPAGVGAGVKYGDAVPGVIRPSDLERIKRVLHVDRFSVIAAVRLGAEEGREVVIAEPLPDETLAKIMSVCESGGFCPDPVGFVGSRVRIVLLQDRDVVPRVTIEQEARGSGQRLVDLRALGIAGEILGWNGRAETADGHVGLSLTPIVEAGGRAGAGLDPPLLIRWNPKRDRFQFFDCVAGKDGTTRCDFQEEVGE
ncbi:MAG TPA: hypothetical protein VEO94_07950 [Candidatus Dormibacteraeota bacterium]|nr:hypothetical protein [Candidatus Dormibacteraeota bacterium]